MGSFRKIPAIREKYRKLFDADVMLWWFAADWAVARRNFEQRRYPCAILRHPDKKNRGCAPRDQCTLSLARGVCATLHRHLDPTRPDQGEHARHPRRLRRKAIGRPRSIHPPIHKRREAPVIHLKYPKAPIPDQGFFTFLLTSIVLQEQNPGLGNHEGQWPSMRTE